MLAGNAPCTSMPRGARRAGVRIEEITSLGELESLREEWSALWKRCPDATPFQAPAWTIAWARHFAPDRTRALAVRRGGFLTAMVPFFTWNQAVLLAGTGPTDYCDGLFAPGHHDLATHVLGALVTVGQHGSLRVDLQQLRADSPLLQATTPNGCLEELHEGDACPVARLSGCDGLGEISRERLTKLGRLQRRLLHSTEWVSCRGTGQDIQEAAETMQRLHTRRWQSRGSPGVLADPLMRAFMRTVMLDLSAAGILHLTQLKVENRAVAIVFALRSGRAAYYYLGGFDPAWSHASPGTLAILATMKQAAAAGAHEFHFLRGSEPYKYHLGARDRPTYRRVLSTSAAASP
jgi:CelD/BcsL family acetyltransferase involved in cellulose biosynthesis